VSGLLPSLNRKLCGKEYSSLAHAVEAAQVEEQRQGEAEKHTHGNLLGSPHAGSNPAIIANESMKACSSGGEGKR